MKKTVYRYLIPAKIFESEELSNSHKMLYCLISNKFDEFRGKELPEIAQIASGPLQMEPTAVYKLLTSMIRKKFFIGHDYDETNFKHAKITVPLVNYF